jgi:hypothetical protein
MTTTTTSRKSLTWVYMLGAMVLVVGFMFWLGVTSEPSNLVSVREGEDAAAPADGGARVTVTATQLGEDPAQYSGRNVHVAGIQVAGNIGQRAVWLTLPEDKVFLMVLPQEAAGTVQYGQTIEVEGRLLPRTDEVLAIWEREGVIQSDGDRMQAEFAQYYIEASRVGAGQ